MYDLLLQSGRVIDPANQHDGIMDIAIKDGAIAAVGASIDASDATNTQDLSDCVLTPGLIDLHTHVYWAGTSIGVEPTLYAHQAGTTTLIDAGTAGAANFLGFRKHVIEQAQPRILAFLNISFPGIYAFSDSVMVGECSNLDLLEPRECLAIAREHADLIVGIKVRVGRGASGEQGIAPLDIALEVADELGIPVMCHLDLPPPSRLDVVSRLRRGDILTHCFRPFPNSPAHLRTATVREEIIAARERGVIFDIGHGKGSFGYATAEVMLQSGFSPDCISSDVHVLSIVGPAHDQLVTMSKFLALGMSLNQVITASTSEPAKAVGRPELGHLGVGTPADISVLKLEEGEFEFLDVEGETRTGQTQIRPHRLMVGGKWLKEP